MTDLRTYSRGSYELVRAGLRASEEGLQPGLANARELKLIDTGMGSGRSRQPGRPARTLSRPVLTVIEGGRHAAAFGSASDRPRL